MTDTRTTTKVLKVYPTNGTSHVTVTSGGSWTFGSWTEIIASLSADSVIAGISAGVNAFGGILEYDIGVGGAGAEVSTHVWRTNGQASNISIPMYFFPVPLGPYSAGDRISVRLRGDSGGQSIPTALFYFEDYDGTHVASDAEPMTGTHIGSSMVSVTPNATPWANSSWYELTSGVGNEIAILGLTVTSPVTSDCEWELGVGAAASEVVLTTIRTAPLGINHGLPQTLWLPAALPLASSTRVAVRMRKSGTSTPPHSADLCYHDTTGLL